MISGHRIGTARVSDAAETWGSEARVGYDRACLVATGAQVVVPLSWTMPSQANELVTRVTVPALESRRIIPILPPRERRPMAREEQTSPPIDDARIQPGESVSGSPSTIPFGVILNSRTSGSCLLARVLRMVTARRS